MTQLDADPGSIAVHGYLLPLDRWYEADTHMWVQPMDDETVRVGIDPLGLETNGTLAQLSFAGVGAAVHRGQALGQLEAAKFVGPLVSPVSGTVVAVNEEVLGAPTIVEHDPFGRGWLVQIRPSAPADEMTGLLSGADPVRDWFAAKVAEYRLKGVIAE